ncbi:RNA methyltransferase family protein [Wolffia australiana]
MKCPLPAELFISSLPLLVFTGKKLEEMRAAMAAAGASPSFCGLHAVGKPRSLLLKFRLYGASLSPRCVLEFSPDLAAEEAEATPQIRSPSFFPKKGQTLELVCESLAFKGKGLCKVADTGFVVMCDRALPGERFIGRVTRKKGNYAEVQKVETLTPHRDYVEAPCKYASDCGGCKTQNLMYDAQVRAKEEQVRDLITHVGRFSLNDPEFASLFRPIVPCDLHYHYRNKMEFSFGNQKWVPEDQFSGTKCSDFDGFALGLHAPGHFDKVLHVDKCLLQSEAANMVLAVVQNTCTEPAFGLTPYNVHTHVGFLKHLMLRSGRDIASGLPQLMVNFVTSSDNPGLLSPLVDKIVNIPEVVSVVNNVNTSVGNTSLGEKENVLYGKSTITETLRGLTFQISANSFFQTNTHQAEVLYKLIEECAGLTGDGSEVILDLFCGTGTIGLTLARRARHVYGYEVVADAISDARRNAEINGIKNATFIQGDLNKITDDFGKDFPQPDVVITDPNRPGMHMKLIKFLLKLRAKRIVYVSCNPATCARDLDYLCHGVPEKNIEGCYRLRSLQPVDMFPHTPHIECVCLLEIDS